MFKKLTPRCLVDQSTGRLMRAEDYAKQEAKEWGAALGTFGLELLGMPFEFLSELSGDIDPHQIRNQEDLEHYLALFMQEPRKGKRR